MTRFTKEVAYALAQEFENGTIGAYLAAIEDRNLFVKPHRGGGRKDGLTKIRQIKILRSANQEGIVSRDAASWNYLERMTEMGFIAKETYSSGKSGKRPVRYVLTGKGRSRLALSRNWKLDAPVVAKTKKKTEKKTQKQNVVNHPASVAA